MKNTEEKRFATAQYLSFSIILITTYLSCVFYVLNKKKTVREEFISTGERNKNKKNVKNLICVERKTTRNLSD